MIYIDNSILNDIYSCSTRAWLKYVEHKQMSIQEDGGKARERMAVGSLFHTLFEASVSGLPMEECISILEKKYKETFPEGVEQEKYVLPNLLTIAQAWMTQTKAYFRDFDILAVEKRIETSLAPVVTYFGTPDIVARKRGGGIYIIESKTTGWLREENKKYYTGGSQGKGYYKLVTETYGEEPKGIYWNIVQIDKIPPWDGNVNKRCQKHRVKYAECQFTHVTMEILGPITYRREQIEHWERWALQGAINFEMLQDIKRYEIRRIPTEGMFSYPGCSTCQFSNWCHAGRSMHYMDNLMEEYIWPPVCKDEE